MKAEGRTEFLQEKKKKKKDSMSLWALGSSPTMWLQVLC